jgi:hypothetical protein
MQKNIHNYSTGVLIRPTSRYILFDGENISFDASLVIYINSTKIPPITIIYRIYRVKTQLQLNKYYYYYYYIYEYENLLSL